MKTVQKAALLTALFVCLTALNANAKVFRNAYVSFELADRWNCTLEQTEWVCRTSQPGLAEAIIILTAKEVGPQDSLPAYEAHLKTPRKIMNKSGQPVQSTIYKVESRTIANQPWIDGMHLSSEVNNYYTRYLATIKERIAVLVTFSAHKLHYTKYSADFFRAIESLRVIATKSLMNGQGAQLPGSDLLGGNTQTDLMPTDMGELPDEGSGSGGASGAAKTFLALALLLGGAGAYLLIKRGQKKNKKKR